MRKFDQDREDLIRLIFSICDYARLGYDISTYNSCNDCKNMDCEYRPRAGESVRWNCPLWKDGKTDDQKRSKNFYA